MDEFQRVYVGFEVRRPGIEYVGGLQSTRRPIGIVVERFTEAEPQFPYEAYKAFEARGLDDPAAAATMDAWRTQSDLVRALPAQIKVYWQDTQTLEDLVEGQVLANYPGGGCYRSWDGEFPLFAVETGGYGDITVLTPDGERAVFDMPTPEGLLSDESADGDYVEHVVRAVRAYLTRSIEVDDEPAETADAEQFENAQFEAA